MKLFIFFLLFIQSIGAFAKCGNSTNNFCNVKVLSVYDGDTFYVDIPKIHPLIGKRLGIRVSGVDTPEIRTKSEYEKKMAYQAKAYTSSLLINSKKVDLIDCKKGKYFRLVCSVIADGFNLSDELIKNNLAVKYMK